MPVVRTYARPVNDSVTVRVPAAYRSCMFKILLVPVTEEEASEQQKMPMPPWAGLCEGAITRNISGPHDMDAIRESIAAAERVSVA